MQCKEFIYSTIYYSGCQEKVLVIYNLFGNGSQYRVNRTASLQKNSTGDICLYIDLGK